MARTEQQRTADGFSTHGRSGRPAEPYPRARGESYPRARGCLLGLAIGDAMGAPAENMSAEAIRERWGTIDGFLTDDPAGTDDTEFAAFSALLLIEHGRSLTSADVAAAWREHLVGRETFPGGGFSTLAAVENLRAGLEPPQSGQHLHAWSDSLAMRAAVFGVFAPGSPELAASLAANDGVVELSEEGVYGGQAVAAAVATAMAGADARECVEAGLEVVPGSSWTACAIDVALTIHDPLEALVTRRYPWTDLAPEAVGLAFSAFLSADGEFRRSVTGAISMGRDADTTAAIAGGIAGAHGGVDAIPEQWRAAIGPVTGRCLGDIVAGLELVDLADRLVEASAR